VRINSTFSIEEIEGLYQKFKETLPKHLTLPTQFKKLRIGSLPRLAQFFITIAKRTPSTTIKFPFVDPENNNSKDELTVDPQSVTAVLMFNDVVGTKGMPLKSAMNKNLAARFDKLDIQIDHRLQLIAIDHSNEKYAYPKSLYEPYSGKATTKKPSYYAEKIRDYINSVVKISNLDDYDYDGVGELVCELFDNTHQHARTEFKQGAVDHSIRGIVIDYRMIRQDEIIEPIAGKLTPLAGFLSSSRPVGGPLHLLEISIFDSGAGILSSFESNVVGIEDEVNVVSRSFLKGITSKPNGIGFGRGLNSARMILNRRKGFVGVRTGRLSLYRDYKENPLIEEGDIEFYDEFSNSNKNFTAMNKVEGLSYTILVPIK
jgi:hypothetical protein